MNCKDYKYYRATNKHTGFCKLWSEYIREDDGCNDGEEEEE